MKKRIVPLVAAVGAAVAGYYYFASRGPTALVLTGMVTTNDVLVSPQISGQITQLTVTEGDAVKKGQLLAVIAPDELRAESAYYAQSAEGLRSQVLQSEAALRYQQQQTTDQIRQAESTLAASQSQVDAAAADLENARSIYTRTQNLAQQRVASQQELDQARTAFDTARARLDAVKKQVEAQRASVALARSNAEQVAMRRNQVVTSQHQEAAANAQRQKADVRLAYTELHAPIDGIVDVRAARIGEVVSPGQPVLTLINPDDLWVRADVEETYIDRVRIGQTLTVRLPSGVERDGTVFYRGVDAAFALSERSGVPAAGVSRLDASHRGGRPIYLRRSRVQEPAAEEHRVRRDCGRSRVSHDFFGDCDDRGHALVPTDTLGACTAGTVGTPPAAC